MIQKIAEDASRGDTDEAWDTARALFQTVSDAEILDPALSQNDLLYRLFNERRSRGWDLANYRKV